MTYVCRHTVNICRLTIGTSGLSKMKTIYKILVEKPEWKTLGDLEVYGNIIFKRT
jgi:hypothetical protein